MILPNDAMNVDMTVNTRPRALLSERLKDISWGQKTSTIPRNPIPPPRRTFERIGEPSRTAPLIIFIKTIPEKITATSPLARCTSAR